MNYVLQINIKDISGLTFKIYESHRQITLPSNLCGNKLYFKEYECRRKLKMMEGCGGIDLGWFSLQSKMIGVGKMNIANECLVRQLMMMEEIRFLEQ